MNIPAFALTLLATLDPNVAGPQQPQLGGAPLQAAAASGAPTAPLATADPMSVADPNDARADAIQDFRNQLAPYGQWVEHTDYGSLWVPSAAIVGSGFVPYTTGGHWAYGNDYVWNSTYPFPDAPFHYGRWIWTSNFAWSWVPGAVYRGAWVSWRTDPFGYVGWAPLGPSFYWFGGSARWIYGGSYYAPYSYCHRNQLFSSNIGAVIVRGPEAGRISQRASFVASSSADQRTLASPTLAGPRDAQSSVPNKALGSPTLASPSPASLGIAPTAVTAAGPTRMPRIESAPAIQPPSYTAPPIQAQAPAFAPSYRPAPTAQTQAPAFAQTYRPAPTFQQPSYTTPPLQTQAPTLAPSYRPAPTFQQPSYSAPSPSPLGGVNPPRYSAPSVAPSFSPSRTFNAPSISPGGARRR